MLDPRRCGKQRLLVPRNLVVVPLSLFTQLAQRRQAIADRVKQATADKKAIAEDRQR